jgi:hypothetical protein
VPRSSIIISDEPLSSETNYRTEFVAVLSNQPQGGFITRKPTTDVPMAAAEGDGFGFFFQRRPGYQSGNYPQRGWDFQTGPQRSGGPQTGSQRGRNSQSDYFGREQRGWW